MGRYAKDQEPIPGYRLKRFLGKGGFGEVWKAQAPGGIFAALKFISLSGAPGKKEFAALSLMKTIRHTNLVPMFASWFLDERGNIVSEGQVDIRESGLSGTILLPTGGGKAPEVDFSAAKNAAELVIAMGLGDKSLADRLEECKKQGTFGIPVEELLEYLEGAAKAIDFLNRPTHDLGYGPVAIQHCDIKPLNLLVVGDACQVCDFGLARVLDTQDSRVTALGGSPAYSAPEILLGKPPVESTDQYSLAISYVELRTGFLPFDETSSTLAGVINAHINGKLELSRLSEQEAEVVRKATSLDPTQRFKSCLAMIKALQKILDPASSKSRPPNESSRVVPKRPQGFLPGYKTVRRHATEYVSDFFECQDKAGNSVAMLVRDVSAPGTEFDFTAYRLLAAANFPGLQPLQSSCLLNDKDEVIGDLAREAAKHHAPSKLVMVYDFVPRNLLSRLKEYRRQTGRGIPTDELMRHLRRLAAALDYLNSPTHELNGKKYRIVHGNLSPESIWLNDGEISLSNFASSRALDEDQPLIVSPLTAFEHPYTAPDLMRNKLTSRSDQSSLALLYAHLRTGESPFDASVSISNLRVRKEENSLDLSNLATDERKVVQRALSVMPKDRFESCLEFVAKLDEAIQVRKTHESWVAEPVADDADPAKRTGVDISGTVILTPATMPKTPSGSDLIPGVGTTPGGAASQSSVTSPPPPSSPSSSDVVLASDSAASAAPSSFSMPSPNPPAETTESWVGSAPGESRNEPYDTRSPTPSFSDIGTGSSLATTPTPTASRSSGEIRATPVEPTRETLPSTGNLTQSTSTVAASQAKSKVPLFVTAAAVLVAVGVGVMKNWPDDGSLALVPPPGLGDVTATASTTASGTEPPPEPVGSGSIPMLPQPTATGDAGIRALIADANRIRLEINKPEMVAAESFCTKALQRIGKKEDRPDLYRDALLVRASVRASMGRPPFESAGEKADLESAFATGSTSAAERSRRTLWSALSLIDSSRAGAIPVDNAKPEDSLPTIQSEIDRELQFRNALSTCPSDDFKPTSDEVALVEKATVVRFPTKTVEVIQAIAVNPQRKTEDGIQLVDRLAMIRPNEFAPAAARGLLQFRKNADLAASRVAYERALQLDANHPQAGHVKSVCSLFTVLEDLAAESSPPQALTAAVATFESHAESLRDYSPEIFRYGFEALLERAEKAPDAAPLVRLATIGRGVAAGLVTDEIKQRVRTGLVGHARRLATSPEKLSVAAAAAIAQACDDANFNEPTIRAVLIEAFLLQPAAAEKALTPAGYKAALTKATVPPFSEAAADDGYFGFVRGLALGNLADDEVGRAAACDALALAFKASKSSVPLDEQKCAEAARRIQSQIEQYRFKNSSQSPEWFSSTYREGAPLDRIADWTLALLGTKDLKVDVRLNVLHDFATVVPFLPPEKGAALSSAVAALLDEQSQPPLSDDDRAALLWAAARFQSDDTAGRAAALKYYASLFAHKIKAQRLPSAESKKIYDEIMKPAYASADQQYKDSPTENKSSLAIVFASRAKLLKDHDGLQSDARGQDRVNLRLTDWEKAVACDADQVRFLVGRGSTYREIFPRNHESLSRALADAEAATEKSPNDIDALHLLSSANIDMSRHQTERDRILEFQRASLSAIDLMIKACQKNTELHVRLGEVYCLASTAKTEIANFMPLKTAGERSEVKRLLDEAAEMGRKSVECGNARFTSAHIALGNALEDLAWIVKETEKYDQAIDQFQADVDLNILDGQPAVGLYSLARCRYKKLEAAARPWSTAIDDELKKIDETLKQSIESSKNNCHANFWLATTAAYRAVRIPSINERTIKEIGESEDSFDEAIKAAVASGNPYDQKMAEETREYWRTRWTERFQSSKFQDDYAAMDAATKTSFRAQMRSIQNRLPEMTSLVLAKLHEFEGELAQAFAEYDRALQEPLSEKHCVLLIERGQLQNVAAVNAKSEAESAAAAEVGERALKLAGANKALRFCALRLAGLGRFNAYQFNYLVHRDEQQAEQRRIAIRYFAAAHDQTVEDPTIDDSGKARFIWREAQLRALIKQWLLDGKPQKQGAEIIRMLRVLDDGTLSNAQSESVNSLCKRVVDETKLD